MNINLKVMYVTNEHGYLCFNHAIQVANEGVRVDTEVDDFSDTMCNLCLEDMAKNFVEAPVTHIEEEKDVYVEYVVHYTVKGSEDVKELHVKAQNPRQARERFKQFVHYKGCRILTVTEKEY